jgi:hypothetical protein
VIGAAILSAVSAAFVTAGIATLPETTHYDCVLNSFSAGNAPASRALNEGQKAKFGLPFALELTSMPSVGMKIDWKGDPFHLNGLHSAMWSREGRTWLMNGPWCEDGGELCSVFLSLTPKENGEADLMISPSWPTKNHPTPWVRDQFSGPCTPSGNLK